MAYYFLKDPDLLFSDKLHKSPVKTVTSLNFEDSKLRIPAYLLAKVKRTALRKVTKINLTIPLDWTPDQTAQVFDDTSTASRWIFASMEKSSSQLSIRERLRKIYRHYIAAPAVGNADTGLYNYQFKAHSPYAGFELFTDSLQSPTFLIRCEKQKSALGTRLCSREVAVSKQLVMTYQFPHTELIRWQKVHQTIQTLLKSVLKRKKV